MLIFTYVVCAIIEDGIFLIRAYTNIVNGFKCKYNYKYVELQKHLNANTLEVFQCIQMFFAIFF